jgi:hypothetical protein
LAPGIAIKTAYQTAQLTKTLFYFQIIFPFLTSLVRLDECNRETFSLVRISMAKGIPSFLWLFKRFYATLLLPVNASKHLNTTTKALY